MNQNDLSSMTILPRRENQKPLTKLSIQTKKRYEIDEEEHKEPLVTDIPVINGPIYSSLFGCSKNILNRIDATCKRA